MMRFSGGSFKDRSCGKDVFSTGAFKDKQFREDLFSGMLAIISHAGRMCLAEVLATKSHAEDLFIGGAFEDELCRKDVFSGGACKDT